MHCIGLYERTLATRMYYREFESKTGQLTGHMKICFRLHQQLAFAISSYEFAIAILLISGVRYCHDCPRKQNGQLTGTIDDGVEK